MRWSVRRRQEAAAANGRALDTGAVGETVPAAAGVEERAAIGAARVAAYTDRPGTPVGRVDDLFPGARDVPEVHVRDLTAAVVASALHHHGSLVVRELLDHDSVIRLRPHLHPDPLRFFGPPVSADIDAMVSELASAYEASGVIPVVEGYLGEPPVAAARRIVVRRASREQSGLGWHQDGQFFGVVTALNVWTALDDDVLKRPSLDLVPRRVDHLIAPKHASLAPDREIEAAVSELLGDRPFAEPALRAGDALFLDEMTVHRTGTRSWSVAHRDLAITWFFAPSRIPEGQVALAF